MKEFSIKYEENNKLFSFTKIFSEEDLYVIYESRGRLYRSKASKKWLQSVLKGEEITPENALKVYKSNPNIQRVEVVVGKKASDEVISKFRNSKMAGNKSEEDYNDSPTVTNKPKPRHRGPKPWKVVLVRYGDGGKGYRVYENRPEIGYNGTDVVKFRGDHEEVIEFLKKMKKLHPNYGQG